MWNRSRVPLAWMNLIEHKVHLLASVGGVAFAVVLMFLEMGFLHGLYDSQTYVVEMLNADLVMMHRDKDAVVPTLPFAKNRLIQARGFPGVETVYPLYLDETQSVWKNSSDGREYPILVFGMNPEHPVFLIPEVVRLSPVLKSPDMVLVDSRSKPYFGALEPGTSAELNGHAVRIGGTFPLGPDFRVDGTVLVSERTFFKCLADQRLSQTESSRVEFGLIKLANDANPLTVRDHLRRELPTDVRILTKREFVDSVREYWRNLRPAGYVFGMGMWTGFLIGVVICYQILFADISHRLPQFATLKAMGYPNSYLVQVTLQQSAYLAILGFIPSAFCSAALYSALQAYSGIVMRLTVDRILLLLVLTILMCLVAGLIAIRKVTQADPAEVF